MTTILPSVAVLEMTYSLCEWFMQTYGDWEYKNRPFVMPTDPKAAAPVTEETKKEEKDQEEPEMQKMRGKSPCGRRCFTAAQMRLCV